MKMNYQEFVVWITLCITFVNSQNTTGIVFVYNVIIRTFSFFLIYEFTLFSSSIGFDHEKDYSFRSLLIQLNNFFYGFKFFISLV